MAVVRAILASMRRKAKQLAQEGDYLVALLQGADTGDRLRFSQYSQVAVPLDFTRMYQAWYTRCRSFVEDTMPERSVDVIDVHLNSGGPRAKDRFDEPDQPRLSLLQFARLRAMTRAEQADAIRDLVTIQGIVESAIRYFEGRAFNIEALINRNLASDLLASSKQHLEEGEIRPAGVLAGVVLEREMRQLCDKLQIKYAKTDHDIGRFNTILFGKGSRIENATWKMRVNTWYKIRNKSAHYDTQEGEPTKDEVTELINGVKSFIEFAESQPDLRAK